MLLLAELLCLFVKLLFSPCFKSNLVDGPKHSRAVSGVFLWALVAKIVSTCCYSKDPHSPSASAARAKVMSKLSRKELVPGAKGTVSK